MNPDSILLGGAESPPALLLKYTNRHGLIAGATGTGKTVTLQVILAEGLSARGVPVFAADVKGDLSGISQPGEAKPKLIAARAAARARGLQLRAMPGGVLGPVRRAGPSGPHDRLRDGPAAAVAPAGAERHAGRRAQHRLPLADDQGLLLLDLKDLRAMLQLVGEQRRRADHDAYGNVSKAIVGAIQRALLALENQGGDKFFGEPALDARRSACAPTRDGRGVVNMLAADQLMHIAAALRHLPAVAAVRAVRAAARGRRPRQAEARVLLRRGAPAVRRRAEGAARAKSSRWCG